MEKYNEDIDAIWKKERKRFPDLACSLDVDITRKKGSIQLRVKDFSFTLPMTFLTGFTIGVLANHYGLEGLEGVIKGAISWLI